MIFTCLEEAERLTFTSSCGVKDTTIKRPSVCSLSIISTFYSCYIPLLSPSIESSAHHILYFPQTHRPGEYHGLSPSSFPGSTLSFLNSQPSSALPSSRISATVRSLHSPWEYLSDNPTLNGSDSTSSSALFKGNISINLCVRGHLFGFRVLRPASMEMSSLSLSEVASELDGDHGDSSMARRRVLGEEFFR